MHLDTTLSGSTYSLKDPSTTNLSCQDAANNTTFSGPDNVWGNGTGTNKETGCVDAFFVAQKEKAMLSRLARPQRHDGSGGAWPIRVGLNDQNAYYDGTQVQIGKNTAGQWIGSADVVGHELGHGIDDHTPGGISGRDTQEFVADTFGAATEWYINQAARTTRPTSWSARRSTWSAAARSATCTTRRRSATRTATPARSRARGARGGRSRQPLVLPAGAGQRQRPARPARPATAAR